MTGDAPVVDRVESGEDVSLQPNAGEPLEFDVTAPDRSVFVAGDVRNNSLDSP